MRKAEQTQWAATYLVAAELTRGFENFREIFRKHNEYAVLLTITHFVA